MTAYGPRPTILSLSSSDSYADSPESVGQRRGDGRLAVFVHED